MSIAAEFVETPVGRMFCSIRHPENVSKYPAILVAPAFGDEMNKCRKMLTEVGKALNATGIGLLNPDLIGTGDSEGEFADAEWTSWIEGLSCVCDWAQRRDIEIRGVIGVRTGALLAAQFTQLNPGLELARHHPRTPRRFASGPRKAVPECGSSDT